MSSVTSLSSQTVFSVNIGRFSRILTRLYIYDEIEIDICINITVFFLRAKCIRHLKQIRANYLYALVIK